MQIVDLPRPQATPAVDNAIECSSIARMQNEDHTRLRHVICSVCLLLALLVLVPADELANDASQAPVPTIVAVDPARAAELLKKREVIVLDIRTPAEFAQGHLPGATNIDFTARDFSDRISKLNRDKSYLLHCATGRRSKLSLPTFQELEFKSIYHLEGGIKAWREAGQQVEE